MEFEEKKDFEQNKDKEGEKIVDNLKNDDNELVGERMDVENNIVIEEIDDIRVQNTMQVINEMKDGEKSEHRNTIDSKENGDDIDVKGDNEQKGIEEVKAYKANNIVVGLKDNKMQSVNASKVDEQMGEMETTNIEETTKANEEPNKLETMVMEVVKRDAIVNEKQEEKESIRRMEDEEKDATKEDGVNEVVDEGNTEKVTDENKVSISTNDEEITKVDKEPKALETLEMEATKGHATINETHEENESSRSMEDDEDNAIEEDDVNEEGEGNTKKIIDDNMLPNSLKRKMWSGRRNVGNVKTKKSSEAKEKRENEKNAPLLSSRERPIRERKSVERLVEVIEKEPNQIVVIEKGRGTPLKDIPNVAYKLSRRKPADLKFLHSVLFGRKGKAVDFKNNLLQFSGFAWHESEEKQRVKIKAKLDKYHKDALLDLANLFNLTVSKANIKKEEIIVRLLDFMEAPYATTDTMTAEKEQKSSEDEDRAKSDENVSKDMEIEDDEEQNDTENGIPVEDDAPGQSESDLKETEASEAGEVGKIDGIDSAKAKIKVKTTQKQQRSGIPLDREDVHNAKMSTQLAAKSPVKKPSSAKPSKVGKNETNEKFAGYFTLGKKEKAVGEEQKSGPSKTDLRQTICGILKEVDFNTATFTDLLKMLATHYNMDLTSRKSMIKQLIQEELTKMADETEDNESAEDEDAVKEESPVPARKKIHPHY
ncbi:hypothetical protein HPP92_013583 [Vanilla planifolia]|uniref:DEK-C domain-containing protein n=1 Tax=Vanilla planifolia TaxID=51239 RepID=A0A835QUB1_VANPL|nr:hypothetical protein HPP92_013583 [Vanilla planifolia]